MIEALKPGSGKRGFCAVGYADIIAADDIY